MKVCCLVETVYQLINALNLLKNDLEFKNAEVDLFIRENHFANWEIIQSRIREVGKFNQVNTFQFPPFSNSNIINRLKQIPEFIFAKKMIERAVGKGYHFPAHEYNIILTPNCCQFFKYSLFCCNKATVYCYEDGSLTYSNQNWIVKEVSPLSQKILKLTNKIHMVFPERTYVNNYDLFEKSWDTKVCALPSLKHFIEKEKEIIEYVFGLPSCNYAENKLIYLTQPNPVSEEITKQIANALGKKIIVRYHPRNREAFYVDGEQDKSGAQWELICAEHITDEHILVGACSSAMLSPKMTFGKEPFLIFTYPIYEGKIEEKFIIASKEIVSNFKNTYKNKEKIFVVHSIEELSQTIKRLTERTAR